jgi:hypothetical protein
MLYSSFNIIRMNKSRMMRWVGYVAQTEAIGMCNKYKLEELRGNDA